MTNKKLLDKLHELNYNAHLFLRWEGCSYKTTFINHQDLAAKVVSEHGALSVIHLLEKEIIPFLNIKNEK